MKLCLVNWFIIIINNKYYFPIKNPQQLNVDTTYGIIGGTIGSHLELNNEFMISFWFNYISNTNPKLPFVSFFDETKRIKEYIIYPTNNIIASTDFKNITIPFNLNIKYFCKIEFIKKSESIDLSFNIFTTLTSKNSINSTISTNSNINDFVFMINRLNLNEDLRIEYLTYYDSIKDYSDNECYDGVSNILYFINFRHNYPYTKWIMNEIENEFGPCLNGNNNEYNDNVINANFNDNTKEVQWESSNYNGEILFNDSLKKNMAQFILNISLNIYFKFDILINYKNTSSITTKNIALILLYFFDFKLLMSYEIDSTSQNIIIKFYVYDKLNILKLIKQKTIWGTTMYNGKLFYWGNYLGLRYIILNIKRQYVSSDTHDINSLIHFKTNSLFCETNQCLFENPLGNLNHSNTLDSGSIKINLKSTGYEKEFSIIFKEFSIGLGNLKLKNKNVTSNLLLVESNNINNEILIINSNIEDLERRNKNFYNNRAHSSCNDSNCSICRNDVMVCEYCYKNYYLNSNNCVLNSNSNTNFVNNYSLLKAIDSTINSYTYHVSSSQFYYDVSLSLTTFSTYFVFSIMVHLEYDLLGNIINFIQSNTCSNNFNLFFNKWDSNSDKFNIVIPINNNTCLDNLEIWNYQRLYTNNNDLNNFKLVYKKDTIDCSNFFKDFQCDIGCSGTTNHFIKFNNSLYYGTCWNTTVNGMIKNLNFFKYYYSCPFHCLTCQFNSDLIECLTCENGYILKNKECILKITHNCSPSTNPTLSNNHSKENIFNCNNFCTNITSSINVEYVLRHYRTNNTCQNKDKLVSNCDDPTNNYYNYQTQNCVLCNNCLSFNCASNCNDSNIYEGCLNNDIFYDYTKCIRQSNYNIDCINYVLTTFYPPYYYICNLCTDGKYVQGNNCNNCDSSCLTCSNVSTDCLTCSNGKFLSGSTCNDCNSNCLTCSINSTNCLTCSNGKFLSGNTCNDCNSNCLTCSTNSINCLTCSNGKFLSGSTCNDCNSNCLTCTTNSTNCLTCSNGKFLSGNTCNDCNSNCLTCTTNSINCLTCSNGKFLSGSTCNDCNSNCLTCSINSTNCLTCSNGKFLSGNTCNDCNSNCLTCSTNSTNCLTCSNGKYLSPSNICINCHQNCSRCIGRPNFCSICKTNFYLFNNGCYSRNTRFCENYEIGSHFCQQCLENYYLNNDKNCVSRNTISCKIYETNSYICKECNNFFYLNSLKNCDSCPSNCLKCENSIKCKQCILNYYLGDNFLCFNRNTWNCKNYKINSYICETCKEGYLINNFYECVNCSDLCNTCKYNENYCTSCHEGFKLIANLCIPIKEEIKNCLIYNPMNSCQICNNGYYKNIINTCKKCNETCLTCEDWTGFCLTCKQNYFLHLNNCLLKPKFCITVDEFNISKCGICLERYFLDSNKNCNECHFNCLNCKINYSNCTKCHHSGELITKEINNNYCLYNCLNVNKFFSWDKKECINCKINTINEYKLFNNPNLNNFSDYDFNIDLSKEKYFLIIDIPNFINKDIINLNNIKNNTILYFNNKNQIINYTAKIDLLNKKFLILPSFNSYKKYLNFNLLIKNKIFENFNKCIFWQKKFTSRIYNFNINNYKNDWYLKTNKYYPIYSINSKEYSYFKISVTIFDYLYKISFFLVLFISLFDKKVLSQLTYNLSFLLFFYNANFLIVSNCGIPINTLITLLDLNLGMFDLNNFITFDNTFILNKILNIRITNFKTNKLKTLQIQNIPLSYIIWVFICFIYLFINIFIYFFIYLKNYFKKFNVLNKTFKINAFKNNKVFNDNFSKNSSNSNNLVKINNERMVQKLKKLIIILNFLKHLKIKIKLYIFTFLFIEFPNILLILTSYLNFNIFNDFNNKSNILIVFIIIINFSLILYFFFNFVDLFNKYWKNDFNYKLNDILYYNYVKIFIPFISFEKLNLVYFKLLDFVRILAIYMILLYFSFYPLIQIFIVITFEMAMLIFLVNILNSNYNLNFIKIKELIFLFYLFLVYGIYLYGLNIYIQYLFFAFYLSIVILSLLDLLKIIFLEFINMVKMIIQYFINLRKKKNLNKIFNYSNNRDL